VRIGSRSNVGLGLALLSGAAFGTSGSFASSLIARGWSPGTVVLARVGISAALLTLPALRLLRRGRVSPRAARVVFVYGALAVAGAQLCYFNAIAHLSVAVALLIEYSGILLVVAWGWGRHGQRPRRTTILGCVAALGGLALVLDLSSAHHVDMVGVLWGVGAAIGLAVYFVIASDTDEALSPLVIAWGGLAIGSVLLAAAATIGLLRLHASTTDVTLLERHVSWLIPVLGLAIVAGVIAYLAGISGARLLGAKLASFVGLTEVLCAVVFAWLVLGQRLDVVQLAGGALVVAGIALVRIDELREPIKRSATEARVRPLARSARA